MTYNPEWDEIRKELEPLEIPQHRPNLTSKVFRIELHDLKKQLYKKEIFGKLATHAHVIEFRKRGLPHAHISVIFQPCYKLQNPYDFDKYVSAEILDEKEYPKLYELVAKHMMHGPCGEQIQIILA